MECIACTQCIDACDDIMVRLDRPKGLIRYTTTATLAGAAPRAKLRLRPLIYGAVVAVAFTTLAIVATHRRAADIQVLRDKNAPFLTLDGGLVSNSLRVKIRNRTDSERTYTVAIPDVPGIRLASPDLPLTLAPGESGTASLVVVLPASEIQDNGVREVTIAVSDQAGPVESITQRLLGPETTPRSPR